MRKQFSELNKEELWKLRQEIILNSIYISDYKNSFGFNNTDICNFFEGYVEYLYELAQEDNFEHQHPFEVFDKYDNEDNLCNYHMSVEYSVPLKEEDDENSHTEYYVYTDNLCYGRLLLGKCSTESFANYIGQTSNKGAYTIEKVKIKK